MKCNEIKNNMMALIYDEISQNEKDKMLFHIRECKKCNAEYNEISETSVILQSWPDKTPKIKFVFTEDENQFFNWKKIGLWVKYPLAAAAVLLIFLSLANFQITSKNGSFSFSMSLSPKENTNSGNFVTMEQLDVLQKQNFLMTSEFIESKNREQSADNYRLFSQFAKGMETQRNQDMDVILTNMTQFQKNNNDRIYQTNQNLMDFIKYTGTQIKRESNK